MKMYSVLAHYIVLSAWVREIVNLYVVLDAFADEAQAMLPYHHRINRSLADKKFSLKVFGFVDESCLGISFSVNFRVVHITLSIHHLVPFPVDDRSSGHSHLEDVRVVGYQ